MVTSKSEANDKSQDGKTSNNQNQGNSEGAVLKMDSISSTNNTFSNTVHVVFIVQLPRKSGGTNFVGFQGGNWTSVHVDDLRAQKESEISFQDAAEFSVSEIFQNTYQKLMHQSLEINLDDSLDVSQSLVSAFLSQPIIFNANRRLHDLIQMACSLLYDIEQNKIRTTKRIKILKDLVPKKPTKS